MNKGGIMNKGKCYLDSIIKSNVIIGEEVSIGKNVVISDNTIIGNNVIIEDGVFIDYGVIIKDNVHIKKNSFIGARCILGEYLVDFFDNYLNKKHPLIIGENSIIRSQCIIYGECLIGYNFQSGHNVTIREGSKIGNNVRIGTNGDIQDKVIIGNYVNIHSDVFISAKNQVKDYVWIFPRVLFTNDPTPPSADMVGSIVESFASIGAGAIILPGTKVEGDTLIAAGTIVKGRIESGFVYAGNPCRKIKRIEDVKSKVTEKNIYPWRESFERGMPWEGIGYNKWIEEYKNNEE